MARQIRAPIRVLLDRDGTSPAAFLRERKRYRIWRVEACWKQVGSWWDGEGEQTYFRITATSIRDEPSATNGPEGVYEIALDHASGQWFLISVLD